jgi:lysocardiolipin and lysophospholipid acyltransferase
MQVAAFLFVRRHWEDDQHYLLTMLKYFHDINYLPQLLIFPEGTDYNPHTRARSDQFASKSGLRSYDNVLQPRTTGFVFLVNQIKKCKHNRFLTVFITP